MKITNLNELQKLIKLCRKLGVATMKAEGLEFTLGKDPSAKPTESFIDTNVFPEANIKVPVYNPGNINETTPIDVIQTDDLTQEQLMFYSARPETDQQAAQ